MNRILVDSGVDWLGNIPENWCVKPLGLYLKERNEKVSDVDYEPLSVTKNGIVPQLETAAKSDAHDSRKKVCINDFVINSRSDRKQSCGLSKLNGSVSLINIVLQVNNYVPDYVKYMLDNTMFAEEFYRNGHGIVADLWTTKYSEMRNIYIPEPPEKEQIIIANYLDQKCKKIDEIIIDNNKEIDLMYELKNSIISNAIKTSFSKRTKKTSMSWIGEIADDAKVIPLKHICKFKRGYCFQTTDFGEPNDIKFVSTTDFKDNSINYSSCNTSKKVLDSLYEIKNGDFLYTVTGATIGKAIIVKNLNEKMYYHYNLCKITSDNCDMGYIRYLLQSSIIKYQIDKEVSAAVIPMIAVKTFNNFFGIWRSVEDQKKIAEYLNNKVNKIDKVIEYRKKIIEKLEEYKKSLIYEVVTGKKKV